MAIPKKQEAVEPSEDWLITYADAITLLMAFFVMLLTFAEYDIPAYQEVAAAIKEQVGNREETSPTKLLKIDVQDVVYNMQADQVVNVETDDKGIVIELVSSAFYKPGSADIRDEAVPVLEKIGKTLAAPRYFNYLIEVEGYTDDDPINTPMFPSNWELSAGRATRVVRFFIDEGMDAERLKAVGFAETRAKVPNRDVNGEPIKQNQSINRRVAIRVYPMSLDDRERLMRKVEIEELGNEGTGESGPLSPDGQPGRQPVEEAQ